MGYVNNMTDYSQPFDISHPVQCGIGRRVGSEVLVKFHGRTEKSLKIRYFSFVSSRGEFVTLTRIRVLA